MINVRNLKRDGNLPVSVDRRLIDSVKRLVTMRLTERVIVESIKKLGPTAKKEEILTESDAILGIALNGMFSIGTEQTCKRGVGGPRTYRKNVKKHYRELIQAKLDTLRGLCSDAEYAAIFDSIKVRFGKKKSVPYVLDANPKPVAGVPPEKTYVDILEYIDKHIQIKQAEQ